mgnify:CR=1 FL=1
MKLRPSAHRGIPFNRHALWQVAADAAIIAARVGARLDASASTRDRPVYYDRYLDWQIILVVVAIQLHGLRARPASTTAGGATSRRVTCGRRSAASRSPSLAAFVVFTLFELHPAPRADAASGSSTCSSASRFVAGSRLLARTLHRAAAAGPGRRARQGGAHRRRRRRGAARDQARCCGTRRSATRRSGSSTTTRASSNLRLHGVRVLGTTAELPQRPPRPAARTRC